MSVDAPRGVSDVRKPGVSRAQARCQHRRNRSCSSSQGNEASIQRSLIRSEYSTGQVIRRRPYQA